MGMESHITSSPSKNVRSASPRSQKPRRGTTARRRAVVDAGWGVFRVNARQLALALGGDLFEI
jgi:hypothetical protein